MQQVILWRVHTHPAVEKRMDLLPDDEFVAAFEQCRIPANQWTHQAHLRAARIFLERNGLDGAHILLRVRIIRLNASHGLNETIERGYHETLTRTWLLLVAERMRSHSSADSLQFVAENLGHLRHEAPLRHYTRDRLYSPLARAVFLPPDLEPLPFQT